VAELHVCHAVFLITYQKGETTAVPISLYFAAFAWNFATP
jgi:hypothetical protein